MQPPSPSLSLSTSTSTGPPRGSSLGPRRRGGGSPEASSPGGKGRAICSTCQKDCKTKAALASHKRRCKGHQSASTGNTPDISAVATPETTSDPELDEERVRQRLPRGAAAAAVTVAVAEEAVIPSTPEEKGMVGGRGRRDFAPSKAPAPEEDPGAGGARGARGENLRCDFCLRTFARDELCVAHVEAGCAKAPKECPGCGDFFPPGWQEGGFANHKRACLPSGRKAPPPSEAKKGRAGKRGAEGRGAAAAAAAAAAAGEEADLDWTLREQGGVSADELDRMGYADKLIRREELLPAAAAGAGGGKGGAKRARRAPVASPGEVDIGDGVVLKNTDPLLRMTNAALLSALVGYGVDAGRVEAMTMVERLRFINAQRHTAPPVRADSNRLQSTLSSWSRSYADDELEPLEYEVTEEELDGLSSNFMKNVLLDAGLINPEQDEQNRREAHRVAEWNMYRRQLIEFGVIKVNAPRR